MWIFFAVASTSMMEENVASLASFVTLWEVLFSSPVCGYFDHITTKVMGF